MDGTTLYRSALGERKHPGPWQLPLATEAWPRVLAAPTGSGRTAAVTLGLVAQGLRNAARTPRRLVRRLPMRTLVEQTAPAVRQWFGRLAAKTDGGTPLPRPDDVHVLKGGMDTDGWLERPERPAALQRLRKTLAVARRRPSTTHWSRESTPRRRARFGAPDMRLP